jgi:hypothetical protein
MHTKLLNQADPLSWKEQRMKGKRALVTQRINWQKTADRQRSVSELQAQTRSTVNIYCKATS